MICWLALSAVLRAVDGEAAPFPTIITVAADAPPAERHAAHELASVLNSITRPPSARFNVANSTKTLAAKPQIAVGFRASILLVPANDFDDLGLEGFVCRASGSNVPVGSAVLSGGNASKRGALYAVNNFLESVGVQFLAQDTTILPPALPTKLPALDKKTTPTLEYRQQFEWACNQATNASVDLNVHLGLNKDSLGVGGTNLDPAHGGAVIYAPNPGFVHTSFALVPPAQYKTKHPEWFGGDQLCWKAKGLQEFLASRVLQLLRAQPDSSIISVSQNDNQNYCKTGADRSAAEAEGTPMAPMLQTVNYVADAIRSEFPHVAVDTLAYQYTRPAPNVTRPRPNVIIRLCSIECNFGAPLTDPSNAAFQKDIDTWAKVSSRTYIWNYQTNFHSYLTPFPDIYSIGPNVNYFARNGVKGIFQEGSYNGPGGDMAELRDWVTAKMMWDPQSDPDLLIATFLSGYYGAPAATHMRAYLDVMHGAVVNTSYFMRESFDGIRPAFLTPDVLLRSAAALSAAKAASASNHLHQAHVNRSTIAVWLVVLNRYEELRTFAHTNAIPWPMESTMQHDFDALANAVALTQTAYGAPLVEHEGGGAFNLTALHAQLFKPCAAGWNHSAVTGSCLPTCGKGSSAATAHPQLPANATASSFYQHPPTLTGSWTASAGPPQWIMLSVRSPIALAGVRAVVNMEPNGAASHSVHVDGVLVATWSGAMAKGQALTWRPSTGEALAVRSSVKVVTTASPSWVAWDSISLYAC